MTTTPFARTGVTQCARHLPQHFNGCTCRPGAPTAAEVVGIDLNATFQDAIDKAYEAGVAEAMRRANQVPNVDDLWTTPAPRDPWAGQASAGPRYDCANCTDGFVTDYATRVTSTCGVCGGRGTVPATPLGHDTVTSHAYYGTVFHRSRDGVTPSWPDAMRFEASRDLSDDDDIHKLVQLIGYSYRTSVRGESLRGFTRDSARSFIVAADASKSRRSDVGEGFEEFEADLDEMIRDGSLERTTNRSGPGTKGTRLIEGFGENDLRFEVYYDDVEDATAPAENPDF